MARVDVTSPCAIALRKISRRSVVRSVDENAEDVKKMNEAGKDVGVLRLYICVPAKYYVTLSVCFYYACLYLCVSFLRVPERTRI